MASLTSPEYNVNIQTSAGTIQLNTTSPSKVITELTVSDSNDSLAKEANVTLVNVSYSGKRLSELVSVKNRITIYANIGAGWFTIFTGVIWTNKKSSSDTTTVSFQAYDYLVFCMNSEDYFYYKKGLQTKTIVQKICTAWGLKLSYKYSSIKHARIKPEQSNIGDMMVKVLNKVKDKSGKRYILTIDGTTVVVKYTATNSTVYCIKKNENAISTDNETSMSDMVTKIKIYGQEKTNSIPKLATVSKNTSTYGTLQSVMTKEKSQKLASVKKEANKTLKSKAKPQVTSTITAIDNPCIKRGDKVYVDTDDIKGNRIVKTITHNCVDMTMDIEFY